MGWWRAIARRGRAPARRPAICFLFNAQLHQLMHGITTAIALARDGRVAVDVLCASAENLAYARALTEKLGGAPIGFGLAGPRPLHRLARLLRRGAPPKLLTLAAMVPRLDRYDALAMPERTSLALRRMGVTRPRFIHLDHGAGDRAISADPRIALFDFVLLAGEKQRERFARGQLIRPGHHAIVGYPKFDAADAARDPAWRPFADRRPVVLYNPHFSPLGSWDSCGRPVIDAFAAQDRFNLVVAPHVRLFDDAGADAAAALVARYAACANIRIDPGSDRSIDMSYTATADIYLGDVSSQAYEFARVPRPCLFLNPARVAWAGDEDYGHWTMGPVIDDATDIVTAVDAAVAAFPAYAPEQRRRFAETFDITATPASDRAAAAIAAYLLADRAGRR